MKKTILACACDLLLSTGSVFATAQSAPGPSSEGNVGAGATNHTNMEKGTTTGTSTGKMKAGSSSSMDNAKIIPARSLAAVRPQRECRRLRAAAFASFVRDELAVFPHDAGAQYSRLELCMQPAGP